MWHIIFASILSILIGKNKNLLRLLKKTKEKNTVWALRIEPMLLC
jgi:hypothetical protein